MSDGQEPTQDMSQVDEQEQQPQDGAQDTQQMFPADYVQQLRQEAASYRVKLKEIEKAEEQRREKALAEQEKWKELAEERAAKLEQAQSIEERYNEIIENLKASNQKRIEGVPEERRSLIPDYDDPSKLAAWLDANAALLSLTPKAPNINGAAGSGHRSGTAPPTLSDEELEVAKKMGLTPEQYAESKQKIHERGK